MITKAVIREIYSKFKTPPSDVETLSLPYYIDILKKYHPMRLENGEIIVENVDEFSPFRRMLVRRLTGVMEFSKYVAFVMNEHIFFFEIEGDGMHLHFRPEKKSFWQKIFGKKKRNSDKQ